MNRYTLNPSYDEEISLLHILCLLMNMFMMGLQYRTKWSTASAGYSPMQQHIEMQVVKSYHPSGKDELFN